jgi:membrane-bound lytic murein transglycosylase D
VRRTLAKYHGLENYFTHKIFMKLSQLQQRLWPIASLALLLFAVPVAAQSGDQADDPPSTSAATVATETIYQAATAGFDASTDKAETLGLGGIEGKDDYDEVAELESLESQTLDAVLVGRESTYDSQLLAPFRGTLSSLHQDLGYVAELHQLTGMAPAGSKLLEVDAVRERFENTEVLGLTQHNQATVRAYLDFFDGRGKPILAGWMKRQARFAPLIQKTLREEGLPEDLIYVAMIESGFSPWARSPASAVGLWQFIRSTGRWMGLRIDAYVDERRDPVKATRAAARYLTYLHDKFGSWPLALAGYNGGPGLVARTIKKYNSNDYWFICRQKGMYSETRRYVSKVIAAALVAKNADIFGLDILDKHDPFEFDLVEVPARTRLGLVANAVGSDVDTLEALNPELRRGYTPPGNPSYELRIPKGSTEKFVANFDKISVEEGAEHVTYRVRFGESVEMVGERMEVAPRMIRAANGLEQGELPQIGAELVIPKKALGSWKPKKKNSSKKVVLLPSKKFDHPGRQRYFYRVNYGDTLEAIGRGLQIKPSDIVLWNTIDPKAHLKEGLYLQIFLPAERDHDSLALTAESQVTPLVMGSNAHKSWLRKKSRGSTSGRRWHKVRSGESLWLIARKYKVTVKKIKRWNTKLRRNNTLQPGQKILVYPGR